MIFNELEFVERMLQKGFLLDKYLFELKKLAAYYNKHEGLEADDIKTKLKAFCGEHLPQYNEVRHLDLILKAARYGAGKKNTLVVIPPVCVTEKELETIRTLQDIQLERVAFTLLVLSKVNKHKPKKESKARNAIYDKNGNIISSKHKEDSYYVTSTNELFTHAKFKGNKSNRESLLAELKQKDLIELTAFGTIKVKFVDAGTATPPILTLTHFDDFVLEYDRLTGHRRIDYCKSCRKPMVKVSNRQEYCTACQKEMRLGKYRRYNEKRKPPPLENPEST